jgi:hypothetical protein
MWNDDRTGLQPGRWPVSVCVLAILAVIFVTAGSGVSAQERRTRPKLIVVHDNYRPELSQPLDDTAATRKTGSDTAGPASAVERSNKPSAKTDSSPSIRTFASDLASTTSLSPRIPPLPKTPSFPAVDKLTPSPAAKLPVNSRGHSGAGVKRDGSPVRTTLSEARSSDKPNSASVPERLPSPNLLPQGGKPEVGLAQAAGEALRPIPRPQEAAAEGRKRNEQANHAATDAVPPTIFAAGRRKDESANLATQAQVASPVQPASFSTSELPQARSGSGPLVVVESAGSPPVYYRAGGESLPAWQIVGLSVAISFSLALALLAFSLLLLTLRQQPGGSFGSVVRFEVAQPAGGNITLPFPMPPPSQPMGQVTPSRGPGRVADFAEDILSAAAFGSILGEKRGPQEDNTKEREESILQQIFEDNVALQEKGA